jgi:hypothetical protein
MWLERAKDPTSDPGYHKFSEDYRRARDFAEAAIAQFTMALGMGKVRRNKDNYDPDGNLLLRFLAVRCPERWARKDKVELTGQGGKPLGVQIYLPALRKDARGGAHGVLEASDDASPPVLEAAP